jgi:hypothetical protein
MGIDHFSFKKSDALEDELRAFVNAVKHRTQPLVTGRMGRDALKTALTIMSQINETSKHLLL